MMDNPLILLALLPGLFCLAIEFFGMRGHVVSEAKLHQLGQGMSSERTRELLGKPTAIYFRPDGSQTWLYASMLMWCLVRVRISISDEVESISHHH